MHTWTTSVLSAWWRCLCWIHWRGCVHASEDHSPSKYSLWVLMFQQLSSPVWLMKWTPVGEAATVADVQANTSFWKNLLNSIQFFFFCIFNLKSYGCTCPSFVSNMVIQHLIQSCSSVSAAAMWLEQVTFDPTIYPTDTSCIYYSMNLLHMITELNPFWAAPFDWHEVKANWKWGRLVVCTAAPDFILKEFAASQYVFVIIGSLVPNYMRNAIMFLLQALVLRTLCNFKLCRKV